MLRLIDVCASTLEEFKGIVAPLLPADGILRCVEVYICKLTAQQLAFLFEVVAK